MTDTTAMNIFPDLILHQPTPVKQSNLLDERVSLSGEEIPVQSEFVVSPIMLSHPGGRAGPKSPFGRPDHSVSAAQTVEQDAVAAGDISGIQLSRLDEALHLFEQGKIAFVQVGGIH